MMADTPWIGPPAGDVSHLEADGLRLGSPPIGAVDRHVIRMGVQP